MNSSLPRRLVIIHTLALLIFMFTFSQHWFLTDIPYDCFYIPFFLASGPLVYGIAHTLQHHSEAFFPQVLVCWDLIPGLVCLILGGIQWWTLGKVLVWIKKSSPNA